MGLLNHGVKARTPAFLWVIGMAVTGDKDMGAPGQIWARVHICVLHFHVHMLFIICAFIIYIATHFVLADSGCATPSC